MTASDEKLIGLVQKLNVLSDNKPADRTKLVAALMDIQAVLEDECDGVSVDVFAAMQPELRKTSLMSLVAIFMLSTE